MKKFIVTAMAATIVIGATAQSKKKSQPKPPPPSCQFNAPPEPPPPPPPPPPSIVDEAMQPSDALPGDYQDFLKRNPGVASLHWKKNNVVVSLKSGTEEKFPLTEEGIKRVEAKFGKLPIAPPPPPPPPPAPPAPPKVRTLS